MPRFGYTLSSEEHGPRDLVRNAARAEAAGFDFCSISDHLHPWVTAQGHSPFVWSVLGGIAEATSSIDVVIGVTCPLIRIHPVVVAHAAATTSLLFDDRFSLGVGSGEALNEHVLGHRWPTPEARRAMLAEAVAVMRELFTGETVDNRGDFYTVENARLFDAPERPIPLIVSGFGQASAEMAGQIGDGLWGHGSDPSLVEAFESAGGTGPRYAQLNVCLGADEAECRRVVHEVWPNAAIPGQLSQDLPTWTHFEQAATLVTEDAAVESVPCGPDLGPVIDAARQFADAGYDHVYLHQIGPDQDALLSRWAGDLGAELRSIDGSEPAAASGSRPGARRREVA
ncbi:MAG: TIGR03557 family F420-dependent LLM class oxidoreductase [Acidimicrobiales bacterium]